MRVLGSLLASEAHSFLLVKNDASTNWGGGRNKREERASRAAPAAPEPRRGRLRGGTDRIPPIDEERVWKLILPAILAVFIRIKKELKERVEILSVELEKASVLTFYLFSWAWQ